MKSMDDLKGGRFSATDVLLWSAAGLLALAAHAGAVAIMMREPVEVAGANEPPAAIMIDMAPEPVATKVDEEQITQDKQDTEEVKSETVTPPVEPPQEPVAQPQPEPTPPEPAPPEVVEQTPPPDVPPVVPQPEPVPEPPQPVKEETPPLPQPPALENVEVPLPLPKPPDVKPEKTVAETPKPVARKKPQTPPPPPKKEATREAKAQVTQSDTTAAKATSSGLFSSVDTPAKWQARLRAYLQRRQRYPSDAQKNRQEGTVQSSFQVDDNGNIVSATISRSSGVTSLDQSILELLRKASPVPAPPPGANKSISLPFQFALPR